MEQVKLKGFYLVLFLNTTFNQDSGEALAQLWLPHSWRCLSTDWMGPGQSDLVFGTSGWQPCPQQEGGKQVSWRFIPTQAIP